VRTPPVLLDRSPVDLDPQLEQFALNPIGSPGSIAESYRFNQPDGFRCARWSSTFAPSLASPKQLEPLLMPSHQGIWLDNHQCFFPSRYPPRQYDQDLPIPRLQLGTRYRSFQHDQLLT
jgi:hypothetical protein